MGYTLRLEVYFYAQLIHHIVSDWKSCMSPYPNKTVHNMMTSSNVNISALLALCEVNPPVTAGAPSQYKDRLIYVWRFPC